MQACYLFLLMLLLLIVMFLPFQLDILLHEQLDVFIDKKFHRHLIDNIPKCALNSGFNVSLLEAIVAVLLRGI